MNLLVLFTVVVLVGQQVAARDDWIYNQRNKLERMNSVVDGARELASYPLTAYLTQIAQMTRNHYGEDLRTIFKYRAEGKQFKMDIHTMMYQQECDDLLTYHGDYERNHVGFVLAYMSPDFDGYELLAGNPVTIMYGLAVRGCEEALVQAGRAKVFSLGYKPLLTKSEQEEGLSFTRMAN